jgi:hypothetical protein
MADIHYLHKHNETDPYRNWMQDGESEMAGYLPPDPDRVIYAQKPKPKTPWHLRVLPEIGVLFYWIVAVLSVMACIGFAAICSKGISL